MTNNAAELAIAVAERLTDPVTIATGIAEQARPTLSGLAGTALLHARLSRIDDRFAAAAVAHWNHAAACARTAGTTGTGTFTGPGAMAASLILGTPYLPDPARHRSQCADAARWLSAHAQSVAERHRHQLQLGPSITPWTVYDAINGLTGTARILIAAVEQGHHHALPGLDAALHTLTTMIGTPVGSRPGWWLPADVHPAATAVHRSGAASTGVAHGIAGPLATLAVAHTAGHTVPGQIDAIRTAADWLLHWREPATNTWPPNITGDELDHDTAEPQHGRRDAWCYGTPGIATALTLAAHAAGEDKYRITADAAMRTLAARDPRSWDVEGPTLCHGHAGILQAARDHPELAEHAAACTTAASNPRYRYLFRHHDRGVLHDNPGLLTGATGIALALADHARLPTSTTVSTSWDSVLLLS